MRPQTPYDERFGHDRPLHYWQVYSTQRSAHLTTARVLTRRKADGDVADQLICDFALFHLEADLRWLEPTP